jgi:prepilin-type N-terminal cleavage/methylation domain-containing protein
VKRSGEHGFTMIELLVAMVLLVIGIMALAETFVAAAKLTLVSERQSSMAHVGRNELERLQGLGYARLALTSNPTTTNPNSRVSSTSGKSYLQWDPSSTATEQMVIDAAGGVSPAPAPWSSGKSSGLIYDFVTYHADGNCGAGCAASANYKRIVIEVTQASGGAPRNPVIIQTIVADPDVAPAGFIANGSQNPLPAAGTQCQTGSGPVGACQIGIDQGTASSYWLYDTPATGTYTGPPTVDNTLHSTVGLVTGLLCTVLVTTGCPVPDLMGTTLPASASSTPHNYSTDRGGPSGSTSGGGANYQGGRILQSSSGSCSILPPASSSSSNPQAETWVTPATSASQVLNGNGGMTLFMQSASGVTASVTLCVAVWVYPQSILNLISVPPIEISAFAYAVASLPTTPTPVSFTFALGSATTVAIGRRIGVEVWLAASSSSNVAIMYDNPAFASQLQLNVQ